MNVITRNSSNSQSGHPGAKVVRTGKSRTEKTEHNDEKHASDDEDELLDADEDEELDAARMAEGEQPVAALYMMADGFAFDGSLAEAAASVGLLDTAAGDADSARFWQVNEGESSGLGVGTQTILLIAGPILGGIGVWLATSGGGNKPPTVDSASQSVTTEEDTPLTITVNAVDGNNDPLTYSVSTAPGNGSANVSGNMITYSPNDNFNGSDSLVVTVTDPKGASVTQTVDITVESVNDAPEITLGSFLATIESGETAGFDNLAEFTDDVDGDMLTFAAGMQPANGSLVVLLSGEFTYTPNQGFFGTDEFTIVVNDNKGGSDTLPAAVEVLAVDLPPTGNLLSEIVADEDLFVHFKSSITDPDGPAVVFDVTRTPDHGQVTRTGPLASDFKYTPEPDFNGTDSFSITGVNNNGRFSQAFTEGFVVTVRPVNDDPTAPATQAVETIEGMAVNVPLTATDKDGDQTVATVPAADRPGNGTLSEDPNDPDKLIYTPNEGFTGTDTFTITFIDGNGGTARTEVTVTVTPDPNEPITNPPTGTSILEVVTDEDTALQDTSDISDADGDPIEYAVSTNPANGIATIDQNTGAYTYEPSDDFNGQDSFRITGMTGDGSFTQEVSVTVIPVNDAPMFPAEGESINTIQNEPVGGDLSTGTVDIDGDPLTYSNITDPANGTVVVDPDGNYTYTPNMGFTGVDMFDVLVSDDKEGTDTATVEVTVASAAQEISLNGTNPSQPNDNFDAGTGAFNLLVDLSGEAHVRVFNIGTDDRLVFTNGTVDDVTIVPQPGFNGFFVDSVNDPNTIRIFSDNVFMDSGLPPVFTFQEINTTLMFDYVAFQTVP